MVTSPGSFPKKGILSKNIKINPTITIAIPVMTNIFPKDWISILNIKNEKAKSQSAAAGKNEKVLEQMFF